MGWMTLKRPWPNAEARVAVSADVMLPAPPMMAPNDMAAPRITPSLSGRESVAFDGAEPTDPGRRFARTRLLRQRALIRKGARLYSTASGAPSFSSLAMLDEKGCIVAWYEGAGSRQFGGGMLLNNHVSQLYVLEDVQLGIPARDLCNASIHGKSTQTGWRRGSESTIFWATTVIEPILMRDGRLQGFSHLTQTSSVRETHFGMKNWSRWFKNDEASSEATNRAVIPFAKRGLIAGAALLGLIAATQVAAVDAPGRTATPSHARANPYGSGWECEHGYRRVSDTCALIAVPANAYLDATGNRWRCDRGFRNENEACVSVKLPANAYLDESFGTGWRCERGHRELDGACVAVKIPANAYAVDSSVGPGWECERGYAHKATSCEAVPVPANGYLTSYGDGWKCNRGFSKSADACVPLKLPANAYVDVEGNDYSCERGFKKSDAGCAAIQVPTNAHIDYSGGQWQCDRGFSNRGGACVEE